MKRAADDAGKRLRRYTVPLGGEYLLRRPLNQVLATGLQLERAERFKLGVVERVAARKPIASADGTRP